MSDQIRETARIAFAEKSNSVFGGGLKVRMNVVQKRHVDRDVGVTAQWRRNSRQAGASSTCSGAPTPSWCAGSTFRRRGNSKPLSTRPVLYVSHCDRR